MKLMYILCYLFVHLPASYCLADREGLFPEETAGYSGPGPWLGKKGEWFYGESYF